MNKTAKTGYARWLISPAALSLRTGKARLFSPYTRKHSRVLFFHRVSDAWSWLALQFLHRLAQRYGFSIEVRVLHTLPVDCIRDLQQLDGYAAYDAIRLASAWGLEFVPRPFLPAAKLVALSNRIILADPAATTALQVTRAAWRGDGDTLAQMAEAAAIDEQQAAARLQKNLAMLQRYGHYLSGTTLFEGEWFWGLDRMQLFERRLDPVQPGSGPLMSEQAFQPVPREQGGTPLPQKLEFYFSFRSPYSYLAAGRVLNLADRLGLNLQLCPLLPMVTRGIPVVWRKLRYILLDAARVAQQANIPFGPVRDPLGAAVERCLAVYHEAARTGRQRQFMLAAMRAIWCEAAALERDPVLLRVAADAGLDGDCVRRALASMQWRASVEANAARLAVLGQWGVPVLCLRDVDDQVISIAWGQDRIWAIERAALGIDNPAPLALHVQDISKGIG